MLRFHMKETAVHKELLSVKTDIRKTFRICHMSTLFKDNLSWCLIGMSTLECASDGNSQQWGIKHLVSPSTMRFLG